MTRTVVTIIVAILCCAAITSCIKLPDEPVAPAPPIIPDLLSPADSASLDIRDTARLEFRWAAVAGVDSYHVQIARDADFTKPLAVDEKLKTTAFKPLGRLTTVAYYWHVRAIGGNENWTPARRVYIVKPRIEVIIAPLNLGERSAKTIEPTAKTIQVNYHRDGVGKLLIDSLVVLPADSNFSVETKIQAGNAPLSFEPGSATYQAKVRFHPQSPGPKTARVLVKSNDLDFPRVYVALSGTGYAPPLRVYVDDKIVADSFEFDEARVGESTLQDFVMVNSGNENLTVDSVKVFGNSSFSLDRLSKNLPRILQYPYNVQPQLEARIKFAPLQAGTEVEGDLRIVYRYKNEKIVRIIKLKGSGI